MILIVLDCIKFKLFVMLLCHMRSSFSMSLLYHAYVYLEFLILACTIYILAPEYSETTNKLVVENFEDRKIILHSDDVECSVFKTILYSNGARIILSDKNSSKYIKMDKVYFGLSDTDDIIEICVCDMSVSELEHLKKELELQ